MKNIYTFKELLNTLQQEVQQADMKASLSQWKLWTQFARKPDFPQAGDDVFKGWMPDRYMDWSEINLSIPVRPIHLGFFKRFWLAMKWWLTGRFPVIDFNGIAYEICSQKKQMMFIEVKFIKKKGVVTHTEPKIVEA